MKGVVVFDVDGTISDGLIAERCTGRPGIELLFDTLVALGFAIHVWSGAGSFHAIAVCKTLNLSKYVTAFHVKPDYPIKKQQAVELLGSDPVLIIDDDPGERVEGWPFLLVEHCRGIS